jgi:hypothetical protein
MQKRPSFWGLVFFLRLAQVVQEDYSENVNGMVTVVLPDLTLLNFQRLTAVLISPSNSP